MSFKDTLRKWIGDEEGENKTQFWVWVRPYLIIAPSIFITIGILVPFVSAIVLSFTDFSLKSSRVHFVLFKNWSKLFVNKAFWHALYITAQYTIFAVGSELIIGGGIALLLGSLQNRFAKSLRVILVFPLMVAPIIGTIIWTLMISPSIGILQKGLTAVGLGGFPWAASPNTAMFTVCLVDFWINAPFMIILVLAGIQSLPKSPFEAALIDGASTWFTFKKLTFPMLKPFILIALLFRLMAALQEFGIIYSMTKGGPGNSLMNISLTGYITGFTFNKIGEAMPYILTLWLLINFLAGYMVRQWQKAQKTAAGKA
jgi:multiple sugar transport system permease protein